MINFCCSKIRRSKKDQILLHQAMTVNEGSNSAAPVSLLKGSAPTSFNPPGLLEALGIENNSFFFSTKKQMLVTPKYFFVVLWFGFVLLHGLVCILICLCKTSVRFIHILISTLDIVIHSFNKIAKIACIPSSCPHKNKS